MTSFELVAFTQLLNFEYVLELLLFDNMQVMCRIGFI